jgi:hypothetical protein
VLDIGLGQLTSTSKLLLLASTASASNQGFNVSKG